MITLALDPEWQEQLRLAGLADFESLMHFDGGKCLSRHSRGKTNVTYLPNGQMVFVKQDFYTRLNMAIRHWMHGQRAEANVIRERRNEERVEALGIPVAKVIAKGEERKWIFPGRAVIVMLPVEGRPLDEFARECKDRERVRQAIDNAEQVLRRLQSLGFDWKIDCKPEHFFVADDLHISLIDMERMRMKRKPLPEEYCEMQFRRFRSLLPQVPVTSR